MFMWQHGTHDGVWLMSTETLTGRTAIPARRLGIPIHISIGGGATNGVRASYFSSSNTDRLGDLRRRHRKFRTSIPCTSSTYQLVERRGAMNCGPAVAVGDIPPVRGRRSSDVYVGGVVPHGTTIQPGSTEPCCFSIACP